MRIKRFLAPDMRSALKMVRDEHGPDAVILSNRETHAGIEVVAATDYDEALVQQALRNAGEPSTMPTMPATALDGLDLEAASPPVQPPRPAVVQAREPHPSRADQMIAALAGAPAATRSALADRARTVSRQDTGPAAPTPAISALLREPGARQPAVATDASAPAETREDFRALLARLTDSEEPAPVISERASGIAQVPSSARDDARAPAATAAPLADVQTVTTVTPPAVPFNTAPARAADVSAVPQPAPAPDAPRASMAAPLDAPSYADFAAPAPVAMTPSSALPAPTFDAFDGLAEMAAVQSQVAVVATVPSAAAATLQLVAAQSEDPGIVAMRNELASMRQMMERQMGQFAIERLRGSPARALAFETLQAYGCDDALAQAIASRIDARIEPSKVKAPLLAELARMLTVCRAEPIEDGGVIALIGPTGAGKTTTLAKLAARFAQRHRARDVALVTTDVDRPGAREQLHALGRKLGITVCEANGPEGLTDSLDQLVDYPLVLVDTAGYAARDRALLGQVTWLRATRNLRSLLVLPANLQAHDMAETVRRYRMAQPEAVVLTKLDETGRLGTALAVAVKHGLPLAYTTAGQQVPADLEAADASRLVLALEKLRRAADNPLATEERHVVA
jgi:flagellar biosynthesis protein FlhF